jgi:hypothetical protein
MGMTTVDFGWALTGYLVLSLIILLATSFTTLGWIIHGLILLPIFSIVLVVWWLIASQTRTSRVRVRWWTWALVLLLQVATILVSPGNCYGWSQGKGCYSNLQILMGRAPRTGPAEASPWKPIASHVHSVALAYAACVVLAVSSTSIRGPAE